MICRKHFTAHSSCINVSHYPDMIYNSLFIFSSGASGVETEVSVMEGDSVSLHTGVKTDQQHRITWYYNGIRIAQITGDQSQICTDAECDERFRDRLELDHQKTLGFGL